jgi:hypothetical protein
VSVAKAHVRVLPHRVDKQVEGVAPRDDRNPVESESMKMLLACRVCLCYGCLLPSIPSHEGQLLEIEEH